MLSNFAGMTAKELFSLVGSGNNATASVYPNVCRLAQIFLTLPISTADCKQGFSTIKRIKTRLRSQMSNETLNHCMLNFDSAWSALKNRRITI